MGKKITSKLGAWNEDSSGVTDRSWQVWEKTFIYRHDKLVVVREWVGNNYQWVENVFLVWWEYLELDGDDCTILRTY